MRKLSTFLLFFAMVFGFSLQATNIQVTNYTELKSAWDSVQTGDTIICAPGTYSCGTNLKFPLGRTVVVRSQYTDPDQMAVIICDIGQPTPPENGKTYRGGLVFEYINLQQRTGAKGSSGHIIYINKFTGILNIDILAFRHCDINSSPRGLVRTVPNGDAGYAYTSAGEIEYLEMTDCLVHNIFVTDKNNWPLLYLGHLPVEVEIKNNTFYDMPYVKQIFTMGYAERPSSHKATVSFENNTLSNTFAGAGGYIATGDFLSEETEFHVNNNMFALPNWENDLNLTTDSTQYRIPTIVSCKGGMIYASNNVVDGPRSWIAGQSIDGEGNGGFLVIDTLNTYKMADLGMSWSDFADPQNGNFTYVASSQMATAGTDGGPIGDPRWVRVIADPKTLTLTANIEGAVVTPAKGIYENGEEVTISASTVDGGTFSHWKLLSDNSQLSTENPYTFNITSNMEIEAVYTFLQVCDVNISVAGSNTATYTITPAKDIYYTGDEITIALNTHYINDFLGWSDGFDQLTRTETLSGNLALTATFSQNKYLLGWDFDHLTKNNETFTNLEANHYRSEDNKGIMNLIVQDTIQPLSTRNNKFTGEGKELAYCTARRMELKNFSNPDYVVIEFSTKGYYELNVRSAFSSDNSIFETQKMQYSLDGTTYTDFAEYKIAEDWNGNWMNFTGTLPAAAENQDKVYVRWIADTSSDRFFGAGSEGSETEFFYLSKVVVTSGSITSLKDIVAGYTNQVFTADGKLIIEAGVAGSAEIFTVMGQKVTKAALREGRNEISGLASGIYIIKIGNEVQKALIK